MKNKNLLILGVSGNIGYEITKLFINKKFNIIGLDKKRTQKIEKLKKFKNFKFVKFNLLDKNFVQKFSKIIKKITHL